VGEEQGSRGGGIRELSFGDAGGLKFMADLRRLWVPVHDNVRKMPPCEQDENLAVAVAREPRDTVADKNRPGLIPADRCGQV